MLSKHTILDGVKDEFNKLRKKMEKIAIQYLGNSAVSDFTNWMTETENEESTKIKDLAKRCQSFQDEVANVSKGKWVDSAKKYVNEQSKKFQSLCE